MPEKKKKAVVPRLRFPEFRDAGPWEVKRLGEIGQVTTGKTPRTNDPESWNGEIPWVTPTDINNAKRIYDTARKLTKKGARAAGLLPKDTVLITCIASIGKNAILDRQGSCNQQINAIIPNEEFHTDFIFYLIEKNSMALINLAGGASPAIIPKSEFEKLKLPFPNFSEQQKIADCLSSLDDLIRAEEAALEALKNHKKGLMQQLFPREGETTPRLRFPEFRDAGPWEVKRLGEIVRITGGGTPKRSVEEFWNGDIPWISSSDVSDESIHELKITRRITAKAVSNSATKIVPKNSILLVSRVGVGKLAVSRIPVCTSQDFTNLTPIEDDTLFLGYYLSAWANVLKSFSQGMAIQGFTKEDIENLAIPMPEVTTGEQQKIADCLSSLDNLIRAQGERIEALKQQKKGLMQQLFPSLDEVRE